MTQIPDRPKVLVIGSGGREHTLVATLARSPLRPTVFCAPGNGGIPVESVVNIPISDLVALRDFALWESINLTVVGPEGPLGAGIADLFANNGLRIFGPTQAGAQLEMSKTYFADFASCHDIPVPESMVFTDAVEAKKYVLRKGVPIVIKASGPCLGKGVTVASTIEEAHAAIDRCLIHREFGDAGATIVVQQYLTGHECSYMVVTDGERFVTLAPSRDYKPLNDGDTGPMTGGMGGYSPEPALTPQLEQIVIETIVKRIIAGLAADGIVFRGVLYIALMLTAQGPMVLEVNVRFGDPETQAVLTRLKSDLLPVLWGAASGDLPEEPLEWDPRASVCVAAVSAGYPNQPAAMGKRIHGLEAFDGNADVIFHGGTKRDADGNLVTSGGRVYYATALGDTFAVARGRAYRVIIRTGFEGQRYRGDIAKHLI